MTIKKTHDTWTTLSKGLDPDELYNPGHNPLTGEREPLPDPAADIYDLSPDAHESLKDYINKVSSGEASHQSHRRLNKGNTFQVTPENEESNVGQSPFSSPYRPGQDSETTAKELKDEGTTLGTFLNTAQGFNEDQARYFEDLSNSTYGKWGATTENPFVDGGDGGPLLDKEKGKGGNYLLPSVQENAPTKREVGAPDAFPNPGDTDVQRRISSVMLVNRWNPSNNTPFMTDNKKNQFGYSQQSKMGAYDPNAKVIEEKDLKKIGEDLLSRAVGHNIDPDNTGIGGKYDMAMLPSIEQLTGWNTLSMSKLRAMNTKGGEAIVAADAGVRSSLLTGDGDVDSKKTYGQMTSEYEHFDGPLPLGMVVNTVIGLAALLVTSAIIMGIAEGIGAAVGGKNEGKVPSNTPPIDLAYGRHALSKDMAGDFLSKMFNIHIPEQNFGSSMFFGILLFYGIPAIPSPGSATPGMPGASWTDIMDAIGGIAMAPGYYSVITRNVTRDTQQIERAISEMGTDLGLGGMITQVLKIIEAITTSATWKFLMTMVKVGEKGLHKKLHHPTLHEDINELGTGAVNRHKKSREMSKGHWADPGSKETGRLAWRHSASPSRYIYPASFGQAQVRMRGAGIVDDKNLDMWAAGSPMERMYAPGYDKSFAFPPQDILGGGDLGGAEKYPGIDSEPLSRGRLPKEYVKWIENQLDSEFMPFYFHDLRTNEIISFHAFMTELSDGFSADYSSMSAYGRADDIMIYNKTTRSVSFGFIVAATSQEDMNQMYWDINKLVSMVYPQYSRGRTMISGPEGFETKFIQPFSQIPTASPMLRVRFGDMLKSNYSKFGLMRLFGLGESGDAFNIDQGEVDPAELQAYNDGLKAADYNTKKAIALRQIDPGASDTAQSAALKKALGAKNGIDVTGDNTIFGYVEGDKVMLKSSVTKYWARNDQGEMAKDITDYPKEGLARKLHRYSSNVEVTIEKRVPDGAASSAQTPGEFGTHAQSSPQNEADEAAASGKPGTYHNRMAYMVKIQSASPAWVSLDKKTENGMEYHRALHTEIAGLSPAGLKQIKDDFTYDGAIPTRDGDGALKKWFAGSESTGADPGKENYLVRSFESSMGRGLAGFITDLSFDWAESTWETQPGMRAPQMMKVSVSFAPIHDIPMGLDSDGMMRSVAYNVGTASGLVGHDPIDPDHSSLALERAKAEAAAAKEDSPPPKPPDD